MSKSLEKEVAEMKKRKEGVKKGEMERKVKGKLSGAEEERIIRRRVWGKSRTAGEKLGKWI